MLAGDVYGVRSCMKCMSFDRPDVCLFSVQNVNKENLADERSKSVKHEVSEHDNSIHV